jgi:hypothetical protein
MTELNHGRIQGLRVEKGEPVWNSATVLRTVKFCGDNRPHAAYGSKDFNLKKEVTEMFEIFDREQTFLIEELVVVDGLPVRMTIKETTGM